MNNNRQTTVHMQSRMAGTVCDAKTVHAISSRKLADVTCWDCQKGMGTFDRQPIAARISAAEYTFNRLRQEWHDLIQESQYEQWPSNIAEITDARTAMQAARVRLEDLQKISSNILWDKVVAP